MLRDEEPYTESTVERLRNEIQAARDRLRRCEPRFRPGGQPVTIILVAVPRYPNLADVQRSLGGMSAAEGTSVIKHENGEVSLELALRRPVTAKEIMEALREVMGHQLRIEEALPEESRLRLRFVNRNGR